ncbi:MAG: response regulator [Phycisphaerae bacterium]|nr:response regulator [Phycisphaerae bacterium]
MHLTESSRPIELLLVEDNPGDIRLTREAIMEAGLEVNLSVAMNGDDAMAFLRRERLHARAPRPDLILLDLNLPGKGGREVLAEIKSDDGLATIPVVVLTTSSSQDDINRAYKLHCNCYITKPVDLDQFIDVVRSIERFWATTATLPGN